MFDVNKMYESHINKNSVRATKGKIGRVHARVCGQIARLIFGCEICLGAKIGKNITIPHAIGIVIGSTAIIGNNVTIMPNVVIGANEYPPKMNKKRHATIGDNVLLGANSVIIGDIFIGDNSIIGAGSVVTKNVPSNTTVIGINCHIGHLT